MNSAPDIDISLHNTVLEDEVCVEDARGEEKTSSSVRAKQIVPNSC